MDVLPYKSDESVEEYKKRRDATRSGKEAAKRDRIEWWRTIKNSIPRVQEVVKRLDKIDERIATLNSDKERCKQLDPNYDWRDDQGDPDDLGIEHCPKCEKMTRSQFVLVEERTKLFDELEEICAADRRTIQIARKYCLLTETENSTIDSHAETL